MSKVTFKDALAVIAGGGPGHLETAGLALKAQEFKGRLNNQLEANMNRMGKNLYAYLPTNLIDAASAGAKSRQETSKENIVREQVRELQDNYGIYLYLALGGLALYWLLRK